ncbi:FHA domain-containing protein, partial [Streptomyces sp. UNOC14_S4]|uniref:FHA domain-containing protein n=1 Tax=Streptomyces sp. UNOC14_S4 TaxID=2872340 RepID=UPI001E5DF69F
PLAGPAGYYGESTVQAELCPRCRTPREAQAPFCEECRYNFATQSGPSFGPPPVSSPQGLQSAPPQYTQPPQPYDHYQNSRPSRINRPAEPLTPESHPSSPYGDSYNDSFSESLSESFSEDGDWVLPPPGPMPAAPFPHNPYEENSADAGSQGVPAQAGPPSPVPSPAPVGWVAVIAPDREYFMAMMSRSGPEAAGLNLPAYSPELQLPLSGPQVTIGRRRHSTGESPDIDLSRPPEDPGVSHQHAMLVQQPDGSWAVVDQDSTNGTTINGSAESIKPYVPVPLRDGDRVHVGAWTTITVRRG